MKEMLDYLDIRVSAVYAQGLGPEFLGESLEKIVNSDIPYIHKFLEGGEGETFVLNAPFFKKKLKIKRIEKSWDGVRGIAKIEV